MASSERQLLPEKVFYCASVPRGDYARIGLEAIPELPDGVPKTTALYAVRELLQIAGFDAEKYGSTAWSPLSELIGPSSTVLINPNWVHHINFSGAGLDCMITHPTVIEAVLYYVAKCQPLRVVLGDAPIQDCDFAELQAQTGVREAVERVERLTGVSVIIQDFRASVLVGSTPSHPRATSERTPEDFVLYDLGTASCLEPVTDDRCPFRVVKYDPRKLAKTHALGRHQYSVAKEAIQADVVISLPKLKTHKKAGLTGALKNVIGIVGEKAYLPHHRRGGSEADGDAYEGWSLLNTLVEELNDRANMAPAGRRRQFITLVGTALRYTARGLGIDPDVEGSWRGNDTIWRTILDLQRILHFGQLDGTLSELPQRTVISITDGIIAGERNGPLAPEPVPLGIVTLSRNEAVADWCHAILMGINPSAIPQLRQAFVEGKCVLSRSAPSSIRVICDGVELSLPELWSKYGRSFALPRGWIGCERVKGRHREGQWCL